MNQQNARKYMPLVQALADGKKIQCNDRGEWFDVESIFTETYGPHEYRIKPEPRTFDIWINEKTKRVISVEAGDHDKGEQMVSEWERITVMEVLK